MIGGANVNPLHSRLLLFGSPLLLQFCADQENLVDRLRSDCDEMSKRGIVSVGHVGFGVILCVVLECFAQSKSRESSCMLSFCQD